MRRFSISYDLTWSLITQTLIMSMYKWINLTCLKHKLIIVKLYAPPLIACISEQLDIILENNSDGKSIMLSWITTKYYSLIDIIYIDSESSNWSGVIKLNITDNYSILCMINNYTLNQTKKNKYRHRQNISETHICSVQLNIPRLITKIDAIWLFLQWSNPFENGTGCMKFIKVPGIQLKIVIILKH